MTRSYLLVALALACTVGCGTTVSGDGDEGGGGEGGGAENGGGGEGGEGPGGEGPGGEGPGGEGGVGGEGGGIGVTPCAVPEMACPSGEQYLEGISYCFINGDGAEEWTACCAYSESEANEGFSAACQGCVAPWEEEPSSEDCKTPLVLSFDNRGVECTSAPGATFNLTRQASTSVPSDWPTSATPWLALDVNENGAVDDGGELFGSATRVGDAFARNGFLALRALDENADGVIDAADPTFTKLLVWRDADNSRTSEPGELSLASLEVLSIDLAYTIDRRCDERKNCEVERAAFRTFDAHGNIVVGSVVDVHVRHE